MAQLDGRNRGYRLLYLDNWQLSSINLSQNYLDKQAVSNLLTKIPVLSQIVKQWFLSSCLLA